VSGISHSFSFGSGATTDLSLTAKRDRIYDFTGEITEGNNVSDTKTDAGTDYSLSGRVVKAYVQKFIKIEELQQATITSDPRRHFADLNAMESQDIKDPEKRKKKLDKENYLRQIGSIAGPKFNGVYKIVPATKTIIPISGTKQDKSVSGVSGAKTIISSNELIMITGIYDEDLGKSTGTIPYTDINGYRHIGAFPYGANMTLRNNELTSYNDSVSSTLDNTTKDLIKNEGSTSNDSAPTNSGGYPDDPAVSERPSEQIGPSTVSNEKPQSSSNNNSNLNTNSQKAAAMSADLGSNATGGIDSIWFIPGKSGKKE
jgi:hypothetical protein